MPRRIDVERLDCARRSALNMGRARLAALTLACGLACVPRLFGQAIPTAVDSLVRHVNIIDVTSGATLSDHWIAIRGSRISAIGPETNPRPDAAAVVDGAGAFVIPGLWEMHAHLMEYPGRSGEAVADVTFPLYLANGVTGVRDMGTHDFATLRRLRDAVEAGTRVGPRLVMTGRPLDGRPATDWIKQPVANEAEARQAVRDLKAAGADFVKVYERLPKAAYMAVVDEARRLSLPFVGHLPIAITSREATTAGQRSIEHMGQGRLRDASYGYLAEGASPPPDRDPVQTATLLRALNDALAGRSTEGVWTGDTWAWVKSSAGKSLLQTLNRDLGPAGSLTVLRRRPESGGVDVAVRAKHARGERTYRFLDHPTRGIEWLPDEPDVELAGRVRVLAEDLRSGPTWLTPTLTPLRAIARRRELMASPDPRLEYVTRETRNELDPANDTRYTTWTALEWDFVARTYSRDAHLAASLRHLGVHLLAGTDGVTDYALPGFGVHDELALLVEAGLTPLEALQAATVEPAAFLGRLGDLGSVSSGKLADFVLLRADPRMDIRNAASIRGVVRNGDYFDRAALDKMLNDVRTAVGGRRQEGRVPES